MSLTLSFHDSEVRRVDTDGRTLTVIFSAAHVHRTAQRSGDEGQIGYASGVRLVLSDAAWQGDPMDCLGRITTGHLVVGSALHRMLDLPFLAVEPVRAELQFSNGSVLVVAATAVQGVMDGDARFIESMAC